ncbi:hypothetical protein N7452_001206 [Penicillium brevicompactum]|uniref:Major facilitator superfamily (MFS) profile domain-containing protein n=1 Tax=Penicillium brevicompactum TaxID=5074 RepID=A0A9W9R1W6_PENBR|nr:hypothetical protein N7452_001206 [Penicillium brevicompactum]
MGIKNAFGRSSFARYGRSIRELPRGVICNSTLLFSAMIYAFAGIPMTWDQGSSATIPSLPGFDNQFHISSGSDAEAISTYVSIIYIGYAVGAALSFFVNDRIGRRWAFRLYSLVLIIGQMIVVGAPNIGALYAARIITGMGIGSLSVIGPMSIVEISPKEIRGLLTAMYTVSMGIALTSASFCVLGIHRNVPSGKLQYQIPAFSISIFLALCIASSFFICESPRWLMMVGRKEEAVQTLVNLRRMPADHPLIIGEAHDIEVSLIMDWGDVHGSSTLWLAVKETFTVSSNLRRLQQVLVAYALAQLSGANSVTSYFIPIMSLLGDTGSTERHMFLSGMYGFSKLIFSIIAAFFIIDILGRRKSLFIGITAQMFSHIYIGVFIRYEQQGAVPRVASTFAIVALFIHAFGYAVGLFILPYVFGGELWPNRIRSFGGAVGATFHWLFIYAIKYAFPKILTSMNNWGAFIFFAGWCFLGLLYTYLIVPEVAGLSVEEIDAIFQGPWYNAFTRSKRGLVIVGLEEGRMHETHIDKDSDKKN